MNLIINPQWKRCKEIESTQHSAINQNSTAKDATNATKTDARHGHGPDAALRALDAGIGSGDLPMI